MPWTSARHDRARRPPALVERLEARLVLSAPTPTPQPASVIPTERTDALALQRHQQDLAQAPRAHSVVFFGDSITAYWGSRSDPTEPGYSAWRRTFAPLRAANFGIPSDQTQNLLWRLENGELAGQPRVAVVEIGINNLLYGSDIADRVGAAADGIAAVVSTIRAVSPGTKVLLLGLFTGAERPDDPISVERKQVNAIIANLDDGANVHYLDLSPNFTAPDGTLPDTLVFPPTYLHPTPSGYQVMADALIGPIRQMLAPRPQARLVVRAAHPRRH